MVAGAVAGAAFGGCGGEGMTVEMTADREFRPETINAVAGEEIVFVNPSVDAHTVTAQGDSLPPGAGYFASGGFDSEDAAADDVAGGLIDPGGEFSLTLDEPGTYSYYCIPHRDQGMSGVIVVR